MTDKDPYESIGGKDSRLPIPRRGIMHDSDGRPVITSEDLFEIVRGRHSTPDERRQGVIQGGVADVVTGKADPDDPFNQAIKSYMGGGSRRSKRPTLRWPRLGRKRTSSSSKTKLPLRKLIYRAWVVTGLFSPTLLVVVLKNDWSRQLLLAPAKFIASFVIERGIG